MSASRRIKAEPSRSECAHRLSATMPFPAVARVNCSVVHHSEAIALFKPQVTLLRLVANGGNDHAIERVRARNFHDVLCHVFFALGIELPDPRLYFTALACVFFDEGPLFSRVHLSHRLGQVFGPQFGKVEVLVLDCVNKVPAGVLLICRGFCNGALDNRT